MNIQGQDGGHWWRDKGLPPPTVPMGKSLGPSEVPNGPLCLVGRVQGLGCPQTLGELEVYAPKPGSPLPPQPHSPPQEKGNVDQ